MLFTTVFGFLDGAAPDLWLAVARAGGLAAIALAFRVAQRLGGGVAGGLVAATALAVSTDFLRFAAVGDSEGLLVALLLGAIDLHLSGRRRLALWVAFAACLLRPEAWPFAGLYALWLARVDASARVTVGAMIAGGLALWFGPELVGSGNPFRAGERARDPNPNALAFADDPAFEILKRWLRMLPLAAEVGLVALVGVLVVQRDRLGHALRPLALLTLAAAAWLAVVAVMTESGFSGNARYLVAPVALACVSAGAGLGRALRLAGPGPAVALAVVGLIPLAWAHADDLPADVRAVRNQARLDDALVRAVEEAGGASAVLRCGSTTTGPYAVPALAWRLHAPIRRVDALVATVPGTVFRAAPPPRPIPGAPVVVVDERRWRPIAQAGPWQVIASCERG